MHDSRDSIHARPIFLIGFMGSGKTTVGAALAALLDREFIDLDLMIIERAGRPIHRIMAENGEDGFRRFESEALADAARSTAVVATGGGIVTRPENLRIMQTAGITVWLDAPFELCWQRILTDGIIRPLAPDRETALARYQARRSLYKNAGIRISILDETAEESARVIIERLKRTRKTRK